MAVFDFIRQNAKFLGAGGLISLSSSYGQTYFIAIFAAQIMASFGLSDGEWGGLYTISTTASAIVMLWAGALTDRFRVRALASIVMPGLAVICIAMAINTTVAGLALVVFLLRLFGQGMMSQLAIVAMARWFVARRGLALSISAMGFAVGQSIFPVLFAALLTRFDWRMLWFAAAVMVLVTFPIVYRLLAAERTPQSHAEDQSATGMDGRHWTRRDMLRDPLFWLLMPMLLGPPAWGTSLFFQQVHIAEVKGWPLVEYLALFPLLIAVSVSSTLVSGQLIDRFGSARLAVVYLIPYILAFLVIGFAESLWGAALGLMIFGLGSGIQATLPAAFWAEFYGTRYIGSIKAVSTSVMVLGSAIGPGISGLLIDLGYDFPSQMIAISAYFVVASAFVVVAVRYAAPRLSPASEIDIERA
jgi:MFS family permease